MNKNKYLRTVTNTKRKLEDKMDGRTAAGGSLFDAIKSNLPGKKSTLDGESRYSKENSKNNTNLCMLGEQLRSKKSKLAAIKIRFLRRIVGYTNR